MGGVFIPHVATKLPASAAKGKRQGCTGDIGAQETRVPSLITAVASSTGPALY